MYQESYKSFLDRSTAGQYAWRFIQKTLSECLNAHEICKQKARCIYVPTRLVELSGLDSGPQFRVVSHHQVEPNSQYLTLSYCWGKHSEQDQLMLTKSSLITLSTFQSVSKLPQTIRDATTVVSQLGFRYLWVDRYCIIQDSLDDWMHEAPLMKEVYGNCFLNISASGAEDSETGLFFQRDPSWVPVTLVNVSIAAPNNVKPYIFEIEKAIFSSDTCFHDEPLSQRGWAVQERILAPRVLHFGRYLIYWECWTTVYLEPVPNVVDYSVVHAERKFRRETDKTWKTLLSGISIDGLANPCNQTVEPGDRVPYLFQEWYNIRDLYAQCDLTYPSDKLAAISGLARDMKRRLMEFGCKDTTYLAGIWKCRLPRDLLWYSIRSGHIPSRRANPYRSPSWSWAAIDGPHIMTHKVGCWGPFEVLASVINAETISENPDDDTGRVTHGIIRINGDLFSADVGMLNSEVDEEDDIDPVTSRILTIGHGSETRIRVCELFTKDGEEKCLGSWIMFDTADDFRNSVLCLPIFANFFDQDYNRLLHGLVLVIGLALVEDRLGRFRRVGIFQLGMGKERFQKDFNKAERRCISIL
ncbi:HET-domain-containing protein [Xylariaceae sp. FL0255]|nr:HET-domain-containing protein [Xylariaceae sp. FL0255]